jgi:Flp pilus assembly CpaE family ATPase
VVGFVPSDYQPVVNSINLGQPLVLTDSGSRIATEIRRIAGVLLGSGATQVEAGPQRRGLFGSFFGGHRRSAHPRTTKGTETLQPSISQ